MFVRNVWAHFYGKRRVPFRLRISDFRLFGIVKRRTEQCQCTSRPVKIYVHLIRHEFLILKSKHFEFEISKLRF